MQIVPGVLCLILDDVELPILVIIVWLYGSESVGLCVSVIGDATSGQFLMLEPTAVVMCQASWLVTYWGL